MKHNKERQLQDYITNKLLIVFTLVFVGIFFGMYFYRISEGSITGSLGISKFALVAMIFSMLASIGCGVRIYLDREKISENPYQMITARNLLPVFLVMIIYFGLIKFFSIYTAIKYIYMFLTAVAVQYFVLVTYTNDIYLVTVSNIVNLFFVYYIGQNIRRAPYVALISFAFLGLVFWIIKIAEENKGKIREIMIFHKNTNYKILMMNVAFLGLITITSLVLAFMGSSSGILIGGVYLLMIMFYNTLKLL